MLLFLLFFASLVEQLTFAPCYKDCKQKDPALVLSSAPLIDCYEIYDENAIKQGGKKEKEVLFWGR